MKFVLSVILIIALGSQLPAQKYFTRDGKVTFSSEAPMETIEAVNQKAASVFDIHTGEVEFAVLIKSFRFEKALMEEHFNENYLESGKYPKSTFKGQVANTGEIDYSTNGKYRAVVRGDLTIHGVTHPIEVEGTIVVDNAAIQASSVFEIAVADYAIEIPRVVRDNVAKVVEIRVEIDYKPLEQ